MCRSSHDVPVVPGRLSSRDGNGVKQQHVQVAWAHRVRLHPLSNSKKASDLSGKRFSQNQSTMLVSFSFRRSHPPGSAARLPPALEERSSSPVPYRTRSCTRSGGLALETFAETSSDPRKIHSPPKAPRSLHRERFCNVFRWHNNKFDSILTNLPHQKSPLQRCAAGGALSGRHRSPPQRPEEPSASTIRSNSDGPRARLLHHLRRGHIDSLLLVRLHHCREQPQTRPRRQTCWRPAQRRLPQARRRAYPGRLCLPSSRCDAQSWSNPVSQPPARASRRSAGGASLLFLLLDLVGVSLQHTTTAAKCFTWSRVSCRCYATPSCRILVPPGSEADSFFLDHRLV